MAQDDDEFEFDKQGENCAEKIFWGFLHVLNALKMIAMIFAVAYFWVWTADNRLIKMDILEQLCVKGYLNITFHENRMFGRIDDATAKEASNVKNLQMKEAD